MDFIWGSEAKEEAYEFIMEVFNHLDGENSEIRELE